MFFHLLFLASRIAISFSFVCQGFEITTSEPMLPLQYTEVDRILFVSLSLKNLNLKNTTNYLSRKNVIVTLNNPQNTLSTVFFWTVSVVQRSSSANCEVCRLPRGTRTLFLDTLLLSF